MKKNLLLLAAILVTAFANAQQGFQGIAVYESKTSTEDLMKMRGNQKEMTPEMEEMVTKMMKKMFEKTFVLKFDRTSSLYEEEEKLDDPNDPMAQGMKMAGSMMGGGGKHYKNVKDKVILQEKEIFGKEFLVSDSLPAIQWKMVGETKQIGGYTCYKATAEVPVDKSNMMNYRPKKGAEEEIKKKSEEELQKTNFLDMVEMPDNQPVTAWYTPDIPVNQGPGNYWGLPGLILEVSDGKTTMLCSKITLNPKEKFEIKVPKKGDKVTQAEFADIMAKKMQELQEMSGGQGGGGRRMRIGG